MTITEALATNTNLRFAQGFFWEHKTLSIQDLPAGIQFARQEEPSTEGECADGGSFGRKICNYDDGRNGIGGDEKGPGTLDQRVDTGTSNVGSRR